MSDYDDGPGRTRGIQGSYATVQNTRKIPYLKTNRINAADRAMLSKFFDKQPFFARSWDIYHFEDTDNTKDFFLLPMAQVEQFLWMIEEETGVVLKKPVQFNFPEEAYTDELSLLGTSTTEFEYDDLVASINPPDYENTKGTIKSMTTKTNKAYKAERKRLTSLVHGLQQVVLARRWLGFADAQDPEQVRLRTLFVCVDVESHEVNHSAILEVGVTRLDTAELWGEDGNGEPPQSFEELMKKVEVRHFRVKENRFLKNGRFVADCADKFCFGKTEWVGLQEAPAVMAQLFRFPDGGSGRVVFVGHDAGTDKQYLKKLGYNPDNINGLEMLDTAKMWKAIKQEANPKGLGGLCKELDITAWHLHNAGNDAAYTFQCLLKMALDYCPDRGQQPETVQPPPTPEVKRIIVKLPDPSCYPPNPPKTTTQGLTEGGVSLNAPQVNQLPHHNWKANGGIHPAMPRGPAPAMPRLAARQAAARNNTTSTNTLTADLWNKVAAGSTIVNPNDIKGDGYGWDDSEELKRAIELRTVPWK